MGRRKLSLSKSAASLHEFGTYEPGLDTGKFAGLFEPVGDGSDPLDLPDYVWTRLNLSWVAFFMISGAANLYVAFFYNPDAQPDVRMETWVDFKLFGLMGLTIIFVILQAIYLARFIQEEEEESTELKED